MITNISASVQTSSVLHPCEIYNHLQFQGLARAIYAMEHLSEGFVCAALRLACVLLLCECGSNHKRAEFFSWWMRMH